MRKMKIKVEDRVELLRDELLDDNYCDSKRTVVARGTIMRVVAISPKVHMIKGTGHDSNPYFLNLEMPDAKSSKSSKGHDRVRTNFCNVKRVE
jgi:hypothetical protein